MKFLSLSVFLLGMLCLGSPAWAAAPESFTLERAVERALEANPGLESKLLMIEQARMNVGAAQASFWPRASLVSSNNTLHNSGGVGSSDDYSSTSWSRGVRMNLSIFSGFMHWNNLQKSLLGVEMSAAQHQQAKLELEANVQMTFLQLLALREEMKSAEESLSRIAVQLKAAKAFVAVGMAPQLNVLQNEVELAKAEQQVIRVRNDIRNTEAQLNRFLGFAPEEPVNYTGDLKDFAGEINYTEEEAINTALFSRPDLIVAQKSVAMAFKDLNVRLGEYSPRVDASYDNMRFTKNYDEKRYTDYKRSYWSVGLNVTWDVFSGGSTTFGVLSDRSRVKALEKAYEDTTFSAKTEVIRSLLDITASKELIKVSHKAVVAAKESYDMANKRYMTQIGTITELLDAQYKLTNAQIDASRTLMEYHRARAKFFYSIGRENPGLL